MTRQEAKELWPIIRAYSEGKEIEYLTGGEWVKLKDPAFTYSTDVYRVEPELKYRPFKNAEECFEEMKKHEPVGWTISNPRNYFSVIHIAENGFTLCNDLFQTYSEAFRVGLRFIDGTPFGIEEEQP